MVIVLKNIFPSFNLLVMKFSQISAWFDKIYKFEFRCSFTYMYIVNFPIMYSKKICI